MNRPNYRRMAALRRGTLLLARPNAGAVSGFRTPDLRITRLVPARETRDPTVAWERD
jgi:hypothetical protein